MKCKCDMRTKLVGDGCEVCNPIKELWDTKQVTEDLRSPDANVEAVRDMLLERSQVGLKKYGVTTERKDLLLKDWLQHLQEELCDAAVYVEAQKQRAFTLERLHGLFYSYNPDLPMGTGMKATFLQLMKDLE